MKMRIFATGLSLVVLLAGCATPPKKTDFDKTATVSKSQDKTWERLLEFFTSNSIQIKTIEKASGVIYAERATFDPLFADCGKNGLTVIIARNVSMNVFVKPVDAGRTQVTVNTDFSETRQFDTNYSRISCYSTGVLEREIFNFLSN